MWLVISSKKIQNISIFSLSDPVSPKTLDSHHDLNYQLQF